MIKVASFLSLNNSKNIHLHRKHAGEDDEQITRIIRLDNICHDILLFIHNYIVPKFCVGVVAV